MSTQVNTGTPPTESPNGPNDDALAKKFADSTEPPKPAAEKPQRPEHVPEKFWDAEKGEVNVEAMAKSYAELEKGKSGKKAEEPPAPKEGETPPPTNEVKDALKDAGLNFDEFNAEFLGEGKLSDGSYKKLSEAGYSKEIVDVYVAGLTAQGAALTQAAHDGAGGAEKFAQVQQWAAQNVAQADLDAYNAVLETADPAKIRLAVQGLAAKYAAAEGTDAEFTVNGSGNGADVGDSYESVEQMKADMRKPEYKTDPAFRAKVQAKLGRSSIM